MLTLESAVVAVTVYRRGALVTRRAEISAGPEGYPTAVRLVGLPLALDDASVRLEVEGEPAEGGELPLAGDVRVTVAVPNADPDLPPPDNAELERARLDHAKAQRALDDLYAALRRVATLSITDRGQPEEGQAPARSPTSARIQLLELRFRREASLHEQIAAAVIALYEAEERLNTLRERDRLASQHRNARTHELRKAVVIRLQAPSGDAAPTAQLQVRYFVAGARWAPAYTVQLDARMQHSSLQLRALVRQRTGEDWRNVALTLSTASPQHWTELPELKAIRIGRTQAAPPKTGWRPAPIGADALYADYDRDVPRRPAPRAQPSPRRAPARGGAMPAAEADSFKTEAAKPAAYGGVPHASAAAAPNAASAPPPPQAPMPSAPPAAMMPAARSKGIGLGNLLGSVVAGADARFGGGAVESAALAAPKLEASVDPGVVAGRDLLDYGALQLLNADTPERGRLRRVEVRMLYERYSVQVISTDVLAAQLSRATRRAHDLEQQPPPPGHRWAQGEPGFDYAYVADAAVDVRSDGRVASLAIGTHEAEAIPRYISVPRESQDVFRIVAVRNPLDAPLLAGPADVYVAGKFALTSELETTPPRGRLELGLGVEQAIKISRNIEFEEDTAGLIKRQHELQHTIRIEVQNHLNRTASVEIRERIPVVDDDQKADVEVIEGKVEPAWDEYKPTRDLLEGGRVWKIEVPAGAERKLTASWVARVPNQHELVGGNRRES